MGPPWRWSSPELSGREAVGAPALADLAREGFSFLRNEGAKDSRASCARALLPVIVAQILVVGSGLWLGLILLGLPGTWLVIASAALMEWATEPVLFHTATLATAVGLAVLGELWEFFASSVKARRAGAGRSGAVGALLGGLLGAIAGTLLLPVPVLGTLLGGGLGAFAGASLLEHGGGKELREALRVGKAAAFGHVFGMAGKLAAGVSVWLLLAVTVFVA